MSAETGDSAKLCHEAAPHGGGGSTLYHGCALPGQDPALTAVPWCPALSRSVRSSDPGSIRWGFQPSEGEGTVTSGRRLGACP